METEIRVKRIYDQASKDDGLRVLVDRLWPRGVSKEKARIDRWPKELTPSNDLRKWFHTDTSRHAEFVARYNSELEIQASKVHAIIESTDQRVITLVTATKDLEAGHVSVLQTFMNAEIARAAEIGHLRQKSD